MIKLYIPKYEDLWFRQMFMADEETMSYNHMWGGTIPFPEQRWKECDTKREITIVDVIIYAKHRGNGYGTKAILLLTCF